MTRIEKHHQLDTRLGTVSNLIRGITHQKRWLLDEASQFCHHHGEIVFTKADNAVLNVFSALMILLGTR